MNSLVAFEAILVVSCLISLYLAREAFFPASLFWAFGASTFGIAAILGGLNASGYVNVEAYHTIAEYFAGSVGLIAFAIGAISGLFVEIIMRFWWWFLLALVMALCVVLVLGTWHLSADMQKIVVGIIFLIGLVRLISSGMLAVYLILGAACLAVSDIADGWIAVNTGMQAANIYNVLLSLAVVSFGLSASRDNWE